LIVLPAQVRPRQRDLPARAGGSELEQALMPGWFGIDARTLGRTSDGSEEQSRNQLPGEFASGIQTEPLRHGH
jgi:hypothetical protein